jgi:hypothetical protein
MFMRAYVQVEGAKAQVAATYSNGKYHSAVSTARKALGRGRLVVIGDASMAVGSYPGGQPLSAKDNEAFLYNTISYLLGGSDLGVTVAKFKGASVTAGKKLTVIARVKNFGSSTSEATPMDIIMVTPNSANPAAEVTTLKTVSVKPLDPNKQKRYRVRATVPEDVPPGDYLILVVVDPEGASGDTNPDNNSKTSKKSIRVN